jgi:hypothetical protein
MSDFRISIVRKVDLDQYQLATVQAQSGFADNPPRSNLYDLDRRDNIGRNCPLTLVGISINHCTHQGAPP